MIGPAGNGEGFRVSFTLNGDPISAEVSGSTTLLALLRDGLGLAGTKWGCLVGDCGACTVLVGDTPALSCLLLAAQADGREVTTIEGLAEEGALSLVQAAFARSGAVQCGYCTPGMIMAAEALLRRGEAMDEAEVRSALSGNLCRCTGYVKIVEAVLEACGRRSSDE